MAASSYYSAVQKAYIAFYGRPADPSGLTYWAARIDAAGGNISSIIQAFGTSAEATSLYGGVSNAVAVNTLYQQIFGRDADATGLNFYVGKLLDGSYTLVDIAQRVIDGASGADATIITNKLAAAATFTSGLDTAAEIIGYSGDAAAQTARDWLGTVDATTASVTTATTNLDSTLASIVSTGGATGTTYTLTTSADDVPGTSGNDTINAGVGKLNSSDVLAGGAGHDVLIASVEDETTATLSGIEEIRLSLRVATAGINLSDATGYTAVVVSGTTDGVVTEIKDDSTVKLSSYTDTVTVTLDSNAAQTTANTLTVVLDNSSSGGFNAGGFETINIRSEGDAAYKMGTTETIVASDATAFNISGSQAFTISGTALAANTNIDALETLNASNLSANLTVTADDTNNFLDGAVTISAGSGNDVINMSATLTTTDTIDGNGGTDSLEFRVGAASTYRPTVSDVETVTARWDAAGTLQAQNITGVSTLNVYASANVTIERLNGPTAVTVLGATGSNDNLTVSYQTGLASDVTLIVGGGLTAVDLNDVSISGYGSKALGNVTINSVGSANNSLDDLTVIAGGTVDINAATRSLDIDNVTLTSATNVTIDAQGKAITQDGGENFAASKATTVAVNVAGTSSYVTLGTGAFLKADTVEIAVVGGRTTVGFSAAQLELAGTALDTLTVSSTGADQSDINIATIDLGTVSANTVTINAVAANASSNVILGDLSVTDNEGYGTINLTLAGDGNVHFSGASTLYGSGLISVNGTGFSGNLTLDMQDVGTGHIVQVDMSSTSTSQVIYGGDAADSLTGGSGNDTIGGDAGADTIYGGAGSDTLYGGAGADTIYAGTGTADVITGGNGDDVIELNSGTANVSVIRFTANVQGSGASTDADAEGTDTVRFFGSGDKILFTSITGTGGITTGSFALTGLTGAGKFSADAVFDSAFLGAVGSADLITNSGLFAVYDNGADTFVSMRTDTGTAQAVTVKLEGFLLTAAASAQFTLDITSDGLYITLN